LHMQFEEALQKRVNASKNLLSCLRRSLWFNYKNQRILLYFCCALNCILFGFDLMGLLVLNMHA